MSLSILSLDHRLFHFINQGLGNPVFDIIMPVLRNKLTWIPVYIALAIYAVIKYKKEAWKYIVLISLTFVISDFSTFHILKPFFHRSRPCFDAALQVRLLLDSCGGKWSFPSSHAANHMAISLSIILSGLFSNKIVNAVVFLWAILVGFAQIYVGIHYPLDILAGFAWGAFLAVLLFYAYRRMTKEK